MKNNIAAGFSLVGIVALGISYYFIYFNLESLSDFLLYDVVEPVFIGSMFFVIPPIVMLFLHSRTTKVWLRKFVSWFIPLSFIIILTVPGSSHEAFSLTPDKEITTWILGIIYLIISLAIIIYQSLKSRKTR